MHGLADGCATLGIPVTGGNVSFYNQTGSVPIHPTPVVGVLGVIDDIDHRLPCGFTRPGDTVLLLGTTREELDGGEWAHLVHGHLGGKPPVVDLAAERALAELLAGSAATGAVTGAHDLSDGGLAQALVESVLVGGHGARITLPEPGAADSDAAFVALFAESAARALVTVAPEGLEAFLAAATGHGVPVTELGTVIGREADLELTDLGTLEFAELARAWRDTLPGLFGP